MDTDKLVLKVKEHLMAKQWFQAWEYDQKPKLVSSAVGDCVRKPEASALPFIQ
jgi:hypothetical protein